MAGELGDRRCGTVSSDLMECRTLTVSSSKGALEMLPLANTLGDVGIRMNEKIAENNNSRAVMSALVRLWLVLVVLGPDHTCSDTDFFTARVLKFRGLLKWLLEGAFKGVLAGIVGLDIQHPCSCGCCRP
ncbi:hypothetical protein CIHG_06741 [Coccidioides immitis H538.4]|uniref:Uncharacterized protein n=2 Tax=Coccidioides immitis TaxID=5501 RepID=A0A0J8RUS5_COCIT|nr:hypothetical protein CIRG_01635 [Coccidioides immitis RMSCC 2394]KMU88940.1 hypothetical protein CIHG_06741 [Coccidioides immitis H538.4]